MTTVTTSVRYTHNTSKNSEQQQQEQQQHHQQQQTFLSKGKGHCKIIFKVILSHSQRHSSISGLRLILLF
jgi:hypothetical protein